MRTQSGATCVWKSGANALAAMASLHHMDLHSVSYLLIMAQHSVSSVGKLGNVRCANLKSVPKFDGLLVRMCAQNVQSFPNVGVLVDLCVNTHQVSV